MSKPAEIVMHNDEIILTPGTATQFTPLMEAVNQNDEAKVRELLADERLADSHVKQFATTSRTQNLSTTYGPLHLAALNGNSVILSMLLEKLVEGNDQRPLFNPEEVSSIGTPMTICTERNFNPQCVLALLKAGAEFPATMDNPLIEQTITHYSYAMSVAEELVNRAAANLGANNEEAKNGLVKDLYRHFLSVYDADIINFSQDFSSLESPCFTSAVARLGSVLQPRETSSGRSFTYTNRHLRSVFGSKEEIRSTYEIPAPASPDAGIKQSLSNHAANWIVGEIPPIPDASDILDQVPARAVRTRESNVGKSSSSRIVPNR